MPVYVLHGDDLYSIDRAIEAFAAKGRFDAVDILRIDTRSASAQSILMTVGTPGLFAERRLVILESLAAKEARATRGKTKAAGEDTLTLADVAEAVPESTTVVAVVAGKSDSPWIKEAQRLVRAGSVTLRGFPAPRQRDMPGWIVRQARDQGVRIDPRAAQIMAVRVGEQVSIAGMELQKLATAAGADEAISAELVEALVPQSAEESIFPLVDAITAGRRAETFKLLERQLGQLTGNDSDLALPLIRLLARQFRLLLRIRLLLAEGAKADQIVEDLRLPEYYADRYFSQARGVTQAKLCWALEQLAATEQSLKNGESGEAPLHLLLAELTGAREAVDNVQRSKEFRPTRARD